MPIVKAKFLGITGVMKTVYYVLWRNFVAAVHSADRLVLRYGSTMYAIYTTSSRARATPALQSYLGPRRKG